MTPLAHFQRLFASAIDDDADAGATARLHALIAAGAKLAPGQRVAVYRDSSRRARERALEAIYPVCRQVLGPQCFAGLAASYVDAYPSKAGDLNVYGAGFAMHLQAQARAHDRLAEISYLPDLARLEWHWHAVYYAPNDPSFDAAGFSALAAEGRAERARFRLSGALRLLASNFPVRDIWQRHRDGNDTSAVAMGDGDRLAIRRIGFRPNVEAVETDTFRLLSALSQGTDLGTIAADGLAVEQIPRLIEERWIAGFTAGEDRSTGH